MLNYATFVKMHQTHFDKILDGLTLEAKSMWESGNPKIADTWQKCRLVNQCKNTFAKKSKRFYKQYIKGNYNPNILLNGGQK